MKRLALTIALLAALAGGRTATAHAADTPTLPAAETASWGTDTPLDASWGTDVPLDLASWGTFIWASM